MKLISAISQIGVASNREIEIAADAPDRRDSEAPNIAADAVVTAPARMLVSGMPFLRSRVGTTADRRDHSNARNDDE